ncbi:MAG: hypothetical protein ACE361_18915 [Aureliella sp.]
MACIRSIHCLLVLSSFCDVCLGQAQELREVIQGLGDAQRNTAASFRLRAVQLGSREDANFVSKNERTYFQVRTQPHDVQDSNEFLFTWGLAGVSDMAGKSKGVGTRKELMAKIGGRVFGATCEGVLVPLKARDITSMAEDEEFSGAIEKNWEESDLNPLALPFLTYDAFHGQAYDIPSVTSKFNSLLYLAYEDEEKDSSIWAFRTGGVIEVKCSKEKEFRPIEVSYYHRKSGAPRPEKGQPLGELVYRTRTQWKLIKLGRNGDGKGAKKSGVLKKERKVWLPVKIEMEQVPYGTRNYRYGVEIIVSWRDVESNLLSVEALEQPLGIESEMLAPNDPISNLYYEVYSDLEKQIARDELEEQRKP